MKKSLSFLTAVLVFAVACHVALGGTDEEELRALAALAEQGVSIGEFEASPIWRKCCAPDGGEEIRSLLAALPRYEFIKIYRYLIGTVQALEKEKEYGREIALIRDFYSFLGMDRDGRLTQGKVMQGVIWPLFFKEGLPLQSRRELLRICRELTFRQPQEEFKLKINADGHEHTLYILLPLCNDFMIGAMESMVAGDSPAEIKAAFEGGMKALLSRYGLEGVYGAEPRKGGRHEFHLILKSPLWFCYANEKMCVFKGSDRE